MLVTWGSEFKAANLICYLLLSGHCSDFSKQLQWLSCNKQHLPYIRTKQQRKFVKREEKKSSNWEGLQRDLIQNFYGCQQDILSPISILSFLALASSCDLFFSDHKSAVSSNLGCIFYLSYTKEAPRRARHM